MGFVRIRKGIREYPTMKMEFAAVAGGFLWTISYEEQKVISDVDGSGADKVTDKVGDKVDDKITENQQKILLCIKDNHTVSAQKMSELVGISKRKIEENLKKLKDTGKLVRVGNSKSGYWKVNRDIEWTGAFFKNKPILSAGNSTEPLPEWRWPMIIPLA